MSSKRLTLYLTEKSLDVIGPVDNLSGRVNGIVQAYGRITTDAAPALTPAQWSFLADMLNGTHIEDNTGDYLWADIAEAGTLDGLGEKWQVDAEAFSALVRDLPHAARLAIIDVIVRFWKGADESGSADTEDRLEKAGARFADRTVTPVNPKNP